MPSKKDTISDWLKRFSVETWDRIAFARNRSGLRIHETTLTQNLIYDLLKSQEQLGDKVLLFESKDEKTNGDDIACYVQYKGGYLFFPLQAKLLYKGGKYGAISHKNRLGWQIDALIKYAKNKGGIPLYLFYNYCPGNYNFTQFLSLLEHKAPKHYGCSCVPANDILNKYTKKTNGEREWIIKPSFFGVHPRYGFPFFELLSKSAINSILENQSLSIANKTVKHYTLEELLVDEQWESLELVKESRDINFNEEPDGEALQSKVRYSYSFRPKFRVIFSDVGLFPITEKA